MWTVEAQIVSKAYSGGPVLRGISFTLAPGQGLCLLGPSGTGKTTLLRILAGLERLDGGKLLVHGRPADGEGLWLPPEMRNLNLVFQNLALWPHMRAAAHLHFVLKGRGLARTERQRRVGALLELGQLAHRARAYPAQLSGGEQQRLALLRALATRPRLLLLDEPFSNLGPAHSAPVKAEIERRMQEKGVAVIIATHRAEDAAGLTGETLRLG